MLDKRKLGKMCGRVDETELLSFTKEIAPYLKRVSFIAQSYILI